MSVLECRRTSLKPSVSLSVAADGTGRWGPLGWCGLIFLIKGSLLSRQCPCTLIGGVHYSERDTSNFSPLKNISLDNMIRPGVGWEEGDLQLGTVFLMRRTQNDLVFSHGSVKGSSL